MIKREYSEEIENYRTRLAEALWNIRKLERKARENNLLKRMINHELRTPLTYVGGFISILREEPDKSPEEKEEIYNIIKKGINQMSDISSLFSMDGTSKAEIKKGYERFSLEEIASNNVYTRNKDLIEEEIELDLKYNKIHQQDMKIYSNKGLIETIWKTLTENAGNFAPKYTKIKQGMRFDENGNLEIIMENKHDKNNVKRKFGGLGEGTGLEFVKNITEKLNGKIEILDKPIMDKTYHSCDKYGYILNGREENDYDYGTFAIKLTIPKSEISKKKGEKE